MEYKTFANIDEIPILFEEIFSKETLAESKIILPNSDKKTSGHLIVFVHGFQGNSYDTRMMKNIISMRFPGTELLCSVDNESNTEGDIRSMGEKLAKEINSYIREWFSRGNLEKISLIGHSLGGIIIRTALPYLSEHKAKMHTFLTFSSPHLGCMYQSSTLVGAGMWAMKLWKKSICLDQLAMTDNKDYNQTFMYKLSEAEVL